MVTPFLWLRERRLHDGRRPRGRSRARESLRFGYAGATILLILAGIALHLAYSTHLELVGDEAYYWLWSRHPDISYLDKGPMVAWLIFAGTALCGQTVFGIRLFAALLAAGTGAGLYSLGKDLFSARVGFWSVLLAAVIPLFAVGASLMTIDTVYVFFWTWAAWAFWRANKEGRLRWWLLTGLFVGLGVLSKYTALIELLSFAAFCAWHPPNRVHFRRPHFWVMSGTALLFLLPALVWNVRHDWPTTHWLLQRGGLDRQFVLHPAYVLGFLGAQAGVISPFVFIGLLYLFSQPALLRDEQPATGYTLALFLPLFLLYFVLSIHYHEPPNWTAAAYIGGVILIAAKWSQLASLKPWARWAAVAALLLAVIETGLLLESGWLHLPPKLDPLNRARGARSLAASVSRAQEQTGAQFVMASDYMTASLLSFYLPGQPETFVPITARPLNQLEIWPSYEEEHPAGAALFVSKRNRVSRAVRARFAEIKLLGEVSPVDHGRIVGHYKLYLCQRAGSQVQL